MKSVNFFLKLKFLVWDKKIFKYLFQIVLVYRKLLNKDKQDRQIVSKDTDIIIDGFPRCANSFIYNSFKNAQISKLNIAHHLHAPYQIIEGTRLKKPTVLLIRNPVDAISSLKLRSPDLEIDTLILYYINFYKDLIQYKNDLLVLDFDTIIGDTSSIVPKINNFFGTKFYNITEKNTKQAKENIVNTNKLLEGMDELKLALPSKIKTKMKSQIERMIMGNKKIDELIVIYNQFINIGNFI